MSGRPLIVIAGRHNLKKNSATLRSLIGDLEHAGYAVCNHESRNAHTARWLEEQVEKLWPRHGTGGVWRKRALKALLLLGRPTRWDYFLTFLRSRRSPVAAAANDLRATIRGQPAGQVYLISHSAGCIASTLVASEPSVARLVCFGYPFKHPDRQDEPERTSHLKAVTKPLLIIQGDEDAYGTADDAHRYGLSSSTEVVSLASGHDYDNVDPDEYRRCRAILLAFLEG